MNTWRGMTAEVFYAQRDLRTAEEISEDARLRATVKISVGEAEAESFAGQLTFLQLANLTARWCRSICFVGPTVRVHPLLAEAFPGVDLISAGIKCADRADPFGSFRDGVSSITATVHVGSGSDKCLSVFGAGWIARCGNFDDSETSGSLDDLNPCGPCFAACLGANHLLRRVLGHSDLVESAKVSLWNLEVGNEALDGPQLELRSIGRMAVFGVGAIGSGMLSLLPYAKLQFDDLLLVDADVVELSNLNRAPIFFAEHVDEQKVQVGKRFLERHGIVVREVPEWYSPEMINLGQFDLVVPAANEHGFQRLVMENYPPLMIAASTGDDWTAYLQRHIPINEDCLECRFPAPDNGVASFECGSGNLEGGATGHRSVVASKTGALPFLSFAGAVMAIAEILKLESGESFPITPNCASIRFDTEEYTIINSQRAPKRGCPYCPDKRVYRTVRQSSRYAHLSLSM